MAVPRKGQRKATPLQIEAELRRQERAYQLRMANWTYAEIAASPHPDDRSRRLYSDGRSAQRGFLAARDRHSGADDTAALREEWKLRNEGVFKVLWPMIQKGDQWAMDRYTRLLREHMLLLGINAPVRKGLSRFPYSPTPANALSRRRSTART